MDGPLEVLGRPGPTGDGNLGGALHTDLRSACYQALAVPRNQARLRALDFSWVHASDLFADHLVPARRHGARASGPESGATVMKLSSSG